MNDWKLMTTRSGCVYYYNQSTCETRWNPPPGKNLILSTALCAEKESEEVVDSTAVKKKENGQRAGSTILANGDEPVSLLTEFSYLAFMNDGDLKLALDSPVANPSGYKNESNSSPLPPVNIGENLFSNFPYLIEEHPKVSVKSGSRDILNASNGTTGRESTKQELKESSKLIVDIPRPLVIPPKDTLVGDINQSPTSAVSQRLTLRSLQISRPLPQPRVSSTQTENLTREISSGSLAEVKPINPMDSMDSAKKQNASPQQSLTAILQKTASSNEFEPVRAVTVTSDISLPTSKKFLSSSIFQRMLNKSSIGAGDKFSGYQFGNSSSTKGLIKYGTSPNALDGKILFGAPLFVIGPLPKIVRRCIKNIEARATNAVGIYRISGNSTAVQRLKAAFIDAEKAASDFILSSPLDSSLSKSKFSTPVSNLEEGADGKNSASGDKNAEQQLPTPPTPPTLPHHFDLNDYDVNVVASTLKLFFRELKDSLLMDKMYYDWISAARIQDTSTRSKELQSLLSRLPSENYITLSFLFHHLKWLAQFSKDTKMDAGNLSIVFGPTLLRSEVMNYDNILNADLQNLVVRDLIENYTVFFPDDIWNEKK